MPQITLDVRVNNEANKNRFLIRERGEELTPFGCCNQKESVHPRAACPRKSDVVDQDSVCHRYFLFHFF